jgi:hypothetical protein
VKSWISIVIQHDLPSTFTTFFGIQCYYFPNLLLFCIGNLYCDLQGPFITNMHYLQNLCSHKIYIVWKVDQMLYCASVKHTKTGPNQLLVVWCFLNQIIDYQIWFSLFRIIFFLLYVPVFLLLNLIFYMQQVCYK